MNQEKLNITWHTFTNHYRDMLQALMISNEFADLTLVSDDRKYFKAHKIVLCASSPVLKNIIHDNPSSSPLLYLRGVHSQEVESILQFVYLGKATFYGDRINEFLNVAKSLEIKEIGKDNIINEQLDLGDEPESKQTNKFIVTSNETDYSIDSKKVKANQFVSKASTHIDPKDKIISNVGDIQLSCEQCNYKSKNYNKKYKKKNLVRHIKMNHEEKKFNCNQCNFTTAEQRYLDRHIQSIHEQIRYSCNQ